MAHYHGSTTAPGSHLRREVRRQAVHPRTAASATLGTAKVASGGDGDGLADLKGRSTMKQPWYFDG